jgi:glycosyltransferase involved in cell wall biosynthesis
MTYIMTGVARSSPGGVSGIDKLAAVPHSPRVLRTNPLRLLMVTPHYFPFMGGVETHVYEIARRLVQTAVEVTVLTTDPEGQLPITEQSQRVRIERVRAWPSKRDYCFAPGIYRRILEGSWDLIHVQSYHTFVAPLAMLAAWQARIPYVVTFHGGGHSSPLRNALRGLQWQALRPWLARARRLVAIARFEIELYGRVLGLPPERFVLIPNGFDLTSSSPLTPPCVDGTLIVSVGRLERYKGHHRVISALPHLIAHQPDAYLRIVGSGPFEHELRLLAQRLGVAERVEIRGIPATERQAMAQLISSASLVTLLSEYETHPIAALEALALRRPVLVADNSGMRELAERGWVRTVPDRGTPAQIASAMLAQIRDPLIPQQFESFTWDDSAEALLDLYLEVISRN